MENGFDFSKIGRMVNRAVKNAMDIGSRDFKSVSKDFSKLGKELDKEVKTVSKDFSKIGEDLRKEFQDIGKEFQKGARSVGNGHGRHDHNRNRAQQEQWREAHRDKNYTYAQNEPPHRSYGQNQQRPYPQPPMGKNGLPAVNAPSVSVAGVLLIVFGSLGLGLLALLTIMLILFALAVGMAGSSYLITALILGVFYAIAGSMIGKGVKLCGRTKRFRRYLQEIKGSDFCPIAMLAKAIGQSEPFVVKDLKKMLRKGMFPDGHLDNRESCLILNGETYQQYLHAEEEMKRRQKAEEEQKKQREAQQKKEEEERKKREAQRSSNEELNQAIREGYEYITQIRQANDQIPGEEISKKISHLETVTTKIFEYVEQHPNKLPEIRKFMSYYLPTTLKLLKAYQEFDYQPVQGENIMTAKQEIQKTLDTINLAFENLLDGLFEDAVLDISTDISVLESMLAQEGLTGSDFQQ